MRRAAALRALAVACVLFPAEAYALPFELIVPRSVTVNTSHGSGSGHVAWLVATDQIIDGTELVAQAIAGMPGQGIWGALVLFADAQGAGTGIQPGQGPRAGAVGKPTFRGSRSTIRVLTSYAASGMFFHIWVHWPGATSGNYQLEFAFLINPTDSGSDVARFTMDVTLDPTFQPSNLPSWEVHSAQRVTSVFDSGVVTRVPEPSTFSLALLGVVYTLAKSRRVRHSSCQ